MAFDRSATPPRFLQPTATTDPDRSAEALGASTWNTPAGPTTPFAEVCYTPMVRLMSSAFRTKSPIPTAISAIPAATSMARW